MPEKSIPVRLDILFDFYEYVSSRWAICSILIDTFHYEMRLIEFQFDILYHDISFEVVHLKFHIFLQKNIDT